MLRCQDIVNPADLYLEDLVRGGIAQALETHVASSEIVRGALRRRAGENLAPAQRTGCRPGQRRWAIRAFHGQHGALISRELRDGSLERA